MNQSELQPPAMPDIAAGPLLAPPGVLDWVGMGKVAQKLKLSGAGLQDELNGMVDVFVDLSDPKARGIHMSRLYSVLDLLQREPLTPECLRQLLQDMLESHEGLSTAAMVNIVFELPLMRPALLSDNSGLRLYPAEIQATYANGELVLEMQLRITYSSSCPCSAALARQVVQEAFQEQFGAQDKLDTEQVYDWLGTVAGVPAIPHSQRSNADVRVKLDLAAKQFPFTPLVDLLEGALRTSVQTAVKREDEQEFARLNGQHAMFCEDAARYLKAKLNADAAYTDFYLCVRHMESLHAHDAVAVVTKGVPGGYPPGI